MKKMKNTNILNSNIIQIIILIIAALLFVPFLGNVHLFDWDEINFAESAREMIVTGDYSNVRINYELFWEKPPLFIWMQVISMKVFGVNEFAARFPNALAGIATLLILFNIGKKFKDKQFGLLWVLAYVGSVLPHLYFKSGIIDPWFNLFIFLGVYYFIQFLIRTEKRKSQIVLSALFIALATLTKGPVALLMFLASGFVYLVINKFKMRIDVLDIVIYILTFIFVGGFWFIIEAIRGNSHVLIDFFNYQIRLLQTEDAGHGGFFGYHFVILLFGVFPASIIALKSFRRNKSSDTPSQKMFKSWMMILFWVVLITFTIVKTKIVHYSSLCYFPLTFLCAYAIDKTYKGEFKLSKVLSGVIIFLSVIWGGIILVIHYLIYNKEKIINSNLIKDDFAVANLQADANWSGYEILIGLFLIIGIITSFILIKKNYLKKIIAVFVITTIFINLTMLVIIPKVEKFTQNSAIEFYKKHQDEDAYIETYGFKSYAHLYYTKKKQPVNPKSYNDNWLLEGDIDKITYFVCKITSEEEFSEKYLNFTKLYDKNGFVFFKREPK